MKNFKNLFALVLLLGSFMTLQSCEDNDGALENAGEEIDDAVDEAEDDIEDAVD